MRDPKLNAIVDNRSRDVALTAASKAGQMSASESSMHCCSCSLLLLSRVVEIIYYYKLCQSVGRISNISGGYWSIFSSSYTSIQEMGILKEPQEYGALSLIITNQHIFFPPTDWSFYPRQCEQVEIPTNADSLIQHLVSNDITSYRSISLRPDRPA